MLSVVIPVYKQLTSVRETVGALSHQTVDAETFEVIVVDDASPEPVYFPGNGRNVHVLRHEENRGRAAARNTGIAASRGDRILFLDADSLPHPDLVRRHANPEVAGHALLGRRFEPRWGLRHELARGERPHQTSLYEDDVRFDVALPADAALAAAPWLYAHTHNLSYPRADLDTVGLFDERFTSWGWEDAELAYRLFVLWNRDASRFVYDPDAICYHLPHFADRATLWQDSLSTGLRLFREKHVHFDTELLTIDPRSFSLLHPSYMAHVTRVSHDSDAAAVKDFCSLREPNRRLWAGRHSESASCVSSLDVMAPPTPANKPLLGLDTPLGDDQFDEVVFWDDWRIFTNNDLSRCILEGLRLAPVVVLAATEWHGGDLLASVTDAQTFLEASALIVSISSTPPGVSAIEIRRPSWGCERPRTER